MKWHVFSMLFSIVVGIVGITLIISQTSPQTASDVIRVSFFLALFVSLWGIASLLALWWSYRFGAKKAAPKLTRNAYIHGFILSTISILIITLNITF